VVHVFEQKINFDKPFSTEKAVFFLRKSTFEPIEN